jgi:membrane-bound hydrogenase subunit beta
MNMEEAKTILESTLGDKIKELTTPAPRRMFITVEAADVVEAARAIREKLGITHLSAITGLDAGERFEVLYHFATRDLVPTLRALVSKENPVVPTIIGFFPSAVFYEREVHDMIGVRSQGHPDLRTLVLPDGWPEGIFPLRKDWTYNREKGVIE